MKPRHGVLIGVVLSLVISPPVAEVLYQRAARASYGEIVDDLRRTHPRWLDSVCHEFTRFGTMSGFDPSVTLRRDLQAWMTRRLGIASDLDYPAMQEFRESFNAVVFEAYHDDPVHRREIHLFEWNPWRCAFVVTRSHCNEPACPWTRR